MAKYEKLIHGDFERVLNAVHDGIRAGSSSASYEDGSDFEANGIRCAVRVYERYSMAGSNRVSMSVTLVGHGEDLFLSAITAGGSQAVFFKMNTMGEEAFLRRLVDVVERL
ncbi:DUF6054 family protein [Gordonia sp. CPCC 205333]|uniref:DUF6054 family protein n=1 Tax=Gordonia sp. CPCC 205333 TaxID=3140790 RepID=UPI003AF3B5A3